MNRGISLCPPACIPTIDVGGERTASRLLKDDEKPEEFACFASPGMKPGFPTIPLNPRAHSDTRTTDPDGASVFERDCTL